MRRSRTSRTRPRLTLWRKDLPYRRHRVRRFPYLVFYAVAPEEIRVVAIAHAKRRPGYWRDRA
jgi:hypothetical protein